MARLLWQQRQDIGPAARAYAGMAYEASSTRTLLFGGWTDTGGPFFGDTWAWDGEEWVQLTDTGPSARVTNMAYDSARNVVVLFGGLGRRLLRHLGVGRRGLDADRQRRSSGFLGLPPTSPMTRPGR